MVSKSNINANIEKITLFNSYVADHPLQQIAFDLADYSKSKEHNEEVAYIFMGIDYFTKFLVAYPLKTKQGVELADALEKNDKRHWKNGSIDIRHGGGDKHKGIHKSFK